MKKEKKIASFKTICWALIIGGAFLLAKNLCGKSDRYIIDRVVKLQSYRGSCSGEQVRAPSGKDYVLTAAHCRILEVDGAIQAVTEDNKSVMLRVIAEDPKSDLLLLEGIPNLRGLDIAQDSKRFEEVRTFTHGRGLDTYETKGFLIQDFDVKVLISYVTSPESEVECSKLPKNKVERDLFASYCVLEVSETISNADIQPGSSGGPAVNPMGELVGVASASGGGFSFFVRIEDIRHFLYSY